MKCYNVFNKVYNVLYYLSIASIIPLIIINANKTKIAEDKIIIVEVIILVVFIFAHIIALISEILFYLNNDTDHFLDKYERKQDINNKTARSLYGTFSVLAYLMDILEFDKLFVVFAIIALVSLLLAFWFWYKKRAFISQKNNEGVL